eukprot:6010899-Amphidinium_carterae.1
MAAMQRQALPQLPLEISIYFVHIHRSGSDDIPRATIRKQGHTTFEFFVPYHSIEGASCFTRSVWIHAVASKRDSLT